MPMFTRRVISLTQPQAEWLDGEAARLGINWPELLRRVIDDARTPPPPAPPPTEAALTLDAAFVAAYVTSLAPNTGGAAEAWQTLCKLAAHYRKFTTQQTADFLCQVTGKKRGALVTMADCVATLRALITPWPGDGEPLDGQAA